GQGCAPTPRCAALTLVASIDPPPGRGEANQLSKAPFPGPLMICMDTQLGRTAAWRQRDHGG
ncbi:MAG: hypothetical protein ACYCXT_13885, partial [Acidiferrobacteraceae bacterium]